MFTFCSDPSTLPDWQWMACYLTTGSHMALYRSVLVVLLLLALAAPLALGMGFLGALAVRAQSRLVRLPGLAYVSMVRGVPDIIFFLFVPLAIDQGVEYARHRLLCPDWPDPVRQGNDFIVCPAAKMPLATDPAWVHDVWGFSLALFAFALVFGAFAANTLNGAMAAVPRAQLETGEAYGMTRAQTFRRILLPQMWVYALPGLSNLWMILTKATPLLFLLGIQDVVFWARELGGQKTGHYAYAHPDWRVWYFLGVLVFYLGLTWISQKVFDRLMARLNHGQATAGGEALRKAAA
ncbi:MAG: ABC transporter permease subunit [Rhodobacter sp.]|uniref:ABC transporter permease n=1 Tax=Pararhodobacter sp. TaxID=2127056 RepID=UPI001D97EC7B|nr:ABC transporter permease subunit [Pararhodobacter sp.]MCB1345914.1 ABC transporter permease subunit [Paracoccaceae bacterium]MCC0074761.1 ABC transporter permease subunit [Rhodobacter sp.]HPD93343.1 ABC transporter permease subunit [Pararhodobacter sp.]